MTDRKSIDLERGIIVVPDTIQKGKPKYDNEGRLTNRPFAKTQRFELKADDPMLTLLRESAKGDGLLDQRESVHKNYRKNYKLPSEGPIFRGNMKLEKTKKAIECGDKAALENATKRCSITPGTVQAAIKRVIESLQL